MAQKPLRFANDLFYEAEALFIRASFRVGGGVEAWRKALTRRSPRRAFGYFTLKALLLYPPHAIVMRLLGCYPHTGYSGFIGHLGSSRPGRYGKAKNTQSPPHGAHYHAFSFFTLMGGNLIRNNGTKGTPRKASELKLSKRHLLDTSA